MKNLNTQNISRDEAYKILNLEPGKKYSKEEILNSYKKIMKKIHPDVSPELSRLASIVNESKEIVIKETGSIIGPVEADKIEIYGHLEGKVVAKTIVIGNSAVVKGDILFSETLKTEEGADINGYIKKTESTSLEAAQDEFKLEEIEAKENKEKDNVVDAEVVDAKEDKEKRA